MCSTAKTETRLGLVMAVYLTGLLIGGLYVGMISPARTVIQAGFGIDDITGIWMINIYTLFYAALIPIIGKVADRVGRSRVFMACMTSFCLGSLICGISQQVGGFGLLLVGRVLQAAGAGGIIPVANTEIATTFPDEKRGMALGIAAVVSGVANVFGSVIGSAIFSIFGIENWPVMFYLCIPFCLAVIAAVAFLLPQSPANPERGKMDYAGSFLFALFVLLLLLGMKGLDFANVASSAASAATWGPLLGALAAIGAFRTVERQADDPVFHLEYLHNRPIVITMVVSFFIGCFIISMVLVPDLAEFTMGGTLGSGGYYVMAIGLMSFVTTPVGGKLIDRFGPKPVLMTGLAISVAGLLFLALVAVPAPNFATFVGGLIVVGGGMGLSMGAPTNYMILENTSKEESTSAIATIALIRQIGTSLAPAVYVGFIAAMPGIAGYQAMLLAVAAFVGLSLLALCFYHSPKKES